VRDGLTSRPPGHGPGELLDVAPRPMLRSQHKIRAWLDTVSEVVDVVQGCDLWMPAVEVTP